MGRLCAFLNSGSYARSLNLQRQADDTFRARMKQALFSGQAIPCPRLRRFDWSSWGYASWLRRKLSTDSGSQRTERPKRIGSGKPGVLDQRHQVDMIEARPLGLTASAKEILLTLDQYRPTGCDSWPRSPKGLGDALRRAAPALRQIDIECRCLGKGSGGVVRWELKKKVVVSKSQMSQVPNEESGSLGLGTSGTSDQEISFSDACRDAPPLLDEEAELGDDEVEI